MPRNAPATAVRHAALLAAIVCLCGLTGCGAYSLRPAFDPTIRTVYVPVFRSFSFREDMNLRLTEELVKEIERRTPYRVVDDPDEADTILSGTILNASKYERLVTLQNLPREVVAQLEAEVSWQDVRRGSDPDKKPPTVRFTQPVNFYPELGETALLGYDKAIHLMVQDIVNMMEAQW